MTKRLVIFGFIGILFGFLLDGCTDTTNTGIDTATRDSYIGKWSVTESSAKMTYEVTIYADPNSPDGVFIKNFANTNTSASSVPAGASVKGNTITLDPGQVISGLTINGSGNLSGTKISWNYTLFDGADLTKSTAVYTKI